MRRLVNDNQNYFKDYNGIHKQLFEDHQMGSCPSSGFGNPSMATQDRKPSKNWMQKDSKYITIPKVGHDNRDDIETAWKWHENGNGNCSCFLPKIII